MEVAVLRPQDCLKRHPHHHQHHKNRRNFHQSNTTTNNQTTNNPNPNPTNRSNRRRRSSNSPPPPGPTQARTRTPSPQIAGQVRILKRGEDLPKLASPAPQFTAARPAARPGPFMMDGFYAGSACVTSPPPSELPLPAFFTRRPCGLEVDHHQKIASDLRRVLNLC